MRDYPQVREVWTESGLKLRPGDDPEGIRRKLKRDRHLFLVAEESGTIIGTAMGAWDGRRGWIYPSNDVSVRFFASVGYEVAEMKEAQKSLGKVAAPQGARAEQVSRRALTRR